MTAILLRLILAHILGDFLLQPDKLCEQKKCNGPRGLSAQLVHALIQGALAYIFAGIWNCWALPLCIFAGHFLIDIFKKEYLGNNVSGFIIDQILHLLFIAGIWMALFNPGPFCGWNLEMLNSAKIWAIIIAYLIVFEPTSIFLGLFLKKWTPTNPDEKGLPLGGKWIGYLERVLIITFIITGNIEGVGFLLAAKSIFRFGELNKPNEVRTTEYVLIGTFSSFTIAIMAAFATTIF